MLTIPFRIDHIQLSDETKQTITKHMHEKYYLREDFKKKKKNKEEVAFAYAMTIST